MRLIFTLCLISCIISSPGFAAEMLANNDQKGTLLVSLTANHGTWDTGDIDNRGSQSLTYSQISYMAKSWGAAVTIKGARTSYNTTLDEDALELSTLTDTSFSDYYEHKFGALTLRAGLDLNLPTGKSSYSNDDISRIITDPVSQDLMILNSYGTGLDYTGHFLLVYQLTPRLLFGGGGRYSVTGEYDATDDTDDDEIDPGDTITAVLNSVYILSKGQFLVGQFTGYYSGEDRQSGEEIYKLGDSYSLDLRYIAQWSTLLSGSLNFNYQVQDKNKAVGEDNVLANEKINSNNNQWELYGSINYRYSKQMALLGMAGYRHVKANGYEEIDTLYDGGRTKFYVEPGAMWYFSDKFYTTLKFRYSRIADNSDSFSPGGAVYQVFAADFGITLRL